MIIDCQKTKKKENTKTQIHRAFDIRFDSIFLKMTAMHCFCTRTVGQYSRKNIKKTFILMKVYKICISFDCLGNYPDTARIIKTGKTKSTFAKIGGKINGNCVIRTED